MINLKHVGIYVKDIDKLADFYKQVFSMIAICEKASDSNEVLDSLYNVHGSEIVVTKLITPHGAQTGIGDMIELVQVVTPDLNQKNVHEQIFQFGSAHIAMGVDDIEFTVSNIKKCGGTQKSKIGLLGQNFLCFCTDPEGNWLELIQRNLYNNDGEIIWENSMEKLP